MNIKLTALALAFGLGAFSTSAQHVDLVEGDSGRIGQALFQWTDTQPTGTGYIDPFVRIQKKGVEEGYNTSGRPYPFDEKPPLNYTHDVQMRDLGGGTNINGVIYYQFLLDINEPGNAKALISLDEIRVYTSPNPSQTTRDLDELGTLRYSTSGGWLMLDASRNSGSGSGDMYMFLPKSLFAGVPDNHYFILYSRFGSREAAKSDDSEAGFEEWAIVFHPEPECPDIAATGGAIDCENTTVQLRAAITGTGGTFRWTGPNGFSSTQQNPTVNAPGTYTVTHTVNSCQTSATAVVVDNRKTFNISATGGELTCERSTIQLAVVSSLPGVSYVWSGPGIISGGNTATPTVGAAGTYSVVARDSASGCEARASAIVTDSADSLRISAQGGALDCDTRTIQLRVTSTLPGVTFVWTGPGIVSGANTATPTVNAAGTYRVVGRTAGGCESVAAAIVTDVQREFTISARGGSITCDRPSVQLSVNSAVAGLTYTWSGPGIVSGGTSSTPTVNQPGTYTVVARDTASGCVATASALVQDVRQTFTVSARGGELNCDNPTVQLSATSAQAGLTFLWTGPGIVSGANTATPVVGQAGTYTVVAKDTVTGCQATATAVVTEGATSFRISARGAEINCDQRTVQLLVTSTAAGVTYTWTGPGIVSGADTATPVVNAAGMYRVTGRLANGCEAIAAAIVTDVRREFTVSATGGALSCDRPTVRLGAIGSVAGLTYEWSGPGIISGGNTANPTVNRPGTYTVFAKDGASGCSASATAVVTESSTQFTVGVTGGVLDCIDVEVTLRAFASIPGATFRWSGPGIVRGGDTANVVVNQPGAYTVTATVNGCSVSSAANVTAVNLSVDAAPVTTPPSGINFKVHSAQPVATFEVELHDVPPGYSISNGKFTGWCIEEDDALHTGIVWPGTAHPVLNAPDGWKHFDWRKVNYILNNKGGATADDVQKAIWNYVGASTTVPLALTATAQALVTQAENNADCYTPQPGDVAGVIIKPDQPSQQMVLIELPVIRASSTATVALSAQLSGGSLAVSFNGAAGKTIVVESSTDLRTWTHVQTLSNPTGAVTQTLGVDQGTKARFYRARVQ